VLLNKIMPSTAARGVYKKPVAKAKSKSRTVGQASLGISRRQAGYGLIVVACVYAFLAGFHTIAEKDLGWHMATGRYVLQHHAIPVTDVLSYTSPGAPWIYPPFAGVLFYLLHGVVGYAGLSWFCALSLLTTVAFMLRPPSHQECLVTAVLTVLGVPVLAFRMTPRPDLFTHVFFAVFLILLWRSYRGDGTVHLRTLWLLPLLMMLWVNLHPGFIAGIAVICGYLFLEAIEFTSGSNRSTAVKRLIQIWPVLVATLLATLINPFGLRIYETSLSLAGQQFLVAGASRIGRSSNCAVAAPDWPVRIPVAGSLCRIPRVSVCRPVRHSCHCGRQFNHCRVSLPAGKPRPRIAA